MRYRSSVLQPEEWTLDVDLVSDMQKMLSERLTKAGYQNVDPNRVMYQYFNAQKRIVEPKPRTVHRSREFVCPKPYEQALANFEAKVERGDSLIPYLSDKLVDASYSDGMLNDWNIYHFHLTNRFKDNGWAKRSDYELFAYVTDTDLYLIQVYEHKDRIRLLWIESEQKFTFCEQYHRVVLQLNLEEGFWRACRPMEVFN